MKTQEERLMRQKMHRPSSQKVEEEIGIENKKVITSSREGSRREIKSNASIVEKRNI